MIHPTEGPGELEDAAQARIERELAECNDESRQEAFEVAGFLDGRDFLAAANPYPAGTLAHAAWLRGWVSAQPES